MNPRSEQVALDYYVRHGLVTDPGGYTGLLTDLPTDIGALCRIVQGQLLHVFWAERYGVQVPAERQQEPGIRHVRHLLARMAGSGVTSLTQGLPPEKRLVGNCRTFSVLLCALLRHQGVPARARCGFGTYFEAEKYIDHWVCEYWHPGERRWILVDAQLDDFQCEALAVDFDPLDVPRDRFLVGGKAWQLCRSGAADPGRFGIFDLWGLWFVRGDFVRDVAALNKMSLLPWDGWGIIDVSDDEMLPADTAFLDQLAGLTAEDVTFDQVRTIFETDDRVRVPAQIKSYTDAGTLVVDVGTEQTV
jgi:hypothetical protein